MRRGWGSFPRSREMWPMRGVVLELRALISMQFKSWARRKAGVLAMFIAEPIWFLLFAIPILLFGGDLHYTLNFTLWGWFMFGLVSSGLWGIAGTMRMEVLEGTYEVLMLTNVNRLIIFIGHTLRLLLSELASLLIMILLVRYGFGVDVSIKNPALLIAVFLIGVVAIHAFSMIYASLSHVFRASMVLVNIFQFLIPIATGMFIPLQRMPSPIVTVMMILPFTEMADLIRHATMGTQTILNPTLELILFIVTTLGLVLTSIVLQAYLERTAKRKGLLIRSW